MTLTTEKLLAACAETGDDAGIGVRSVLVPIGGEGAPVKPAIYAGRKYQLEKRWWSEGGSVEPTDVVMIDNVPSQANRLEAALEGLRERLRLPELVLDLAEVGPLPADVPTQLSSFRFPHRQADAYLRDAVLDDKPFLQAPIGTQLLAATADHAEGFLGWFPQALLFGFWQSHLGKKRTQAKLARSMVSEVVGYAPASVDTRQLGLKGDPLNLNVDEQVQYDDEDLLAGWELLEGSKKAGGRKKKDSLTEIGHGQVPIPVSESDAALAGVSFRAIEELRSAAAIEGDRARGGAAVSVGEPAMVWVPVHDEPAETRRTWRGRASWGGVAEVGQGEHAMVLGGGRAGGAERRGSSAPSRGAVGTHRCLP
ncbi:MAG: type I-G CRISPR-associated RAMP protein Csb1/Cas7g [Acidimicrobiales bacterium]